MRLTQKRIRNANKLLSNIENDSLFYIGLIIDDGVSAKLKKISNKLHYDIGLEIFPDPILGKMSERNSVGEYIPLKNEPMEIASRPHYYRLKGWDGNIYTGTCYVPYKRYPRKFIEPKEFKLKIINLGNNLDAVIISEKMKNNEIDNEDIVFGANLMLELFGAVEIFNLDKNMEIQMPRSTKTVNWEILPPGKNIWDNINKLTKRKNSKAEQTLIKDRIEYIYKFNPDYTYQGTGGYRGYMVFEFEKKELYIFESIAYGNATYIFEGEWENVSKLSKKEILDRRLAKDRIVHYNDWEKNINKYLKNNSMN